MQTISNSNFVIGIFKRELKNRFLCEVSVSGEDIVCYVPSSCHLSNFLKLEGKQVLLVPTQAQNARTAYALYAVCYRNSYILLNTSLANRAIESNIRKPRFYFLGARRIVKKEYRIHNYKADLYLPETDTIIEIKSIISTDKVARFPSVYSERTLNQFRSIQQLLKEGHKVCFFVVSLCPSVKEIIIDRDSEFYTEFSKCVQCGMQVAAYNCKISGDELLINKTLIIK